MIDQLKSGNLTSGQLRKMLDEVSRAVDPAAPYGKAADFLKQAAQQIKSGDTSGSAQSLADASRELEKIMAEMADAKELQDSLNAVNKAEFCLATHRLPGLLVQLPSCKAGRTIVVHDDSRHPGGCPSLASTAESRKTYRQKRPMIERTIAWLVRGQNRRLRYLGIEKNKIWLAHRAAAVNLMRMLNLGLSHDGSTWLVATAE